MLWPPRPRGVAEPRGPLRSSGFWLHHAALTWRQQVDQRLRPLGLTHTQFNLLASTSWLHATEGAPTQQRIADMSGSDRMMASKVIANLERRGLVARQADAADARVKRLVTTAAGKSLVHQAVRIVAEIDKDLFGAPGASRDAVTSALQRIVEADGTRFAPHSGTLPVS